MLGHKKLSKSMGTAGHWCRGSGMRSGEGEKGESREHGLDSICFLHRAPDMLDARQLGIFTCSRFVVG